MKKTKTVLNRLYDAFLSEKAKEKAEKLIISIALVCFVLHLFIIWMMDLGFIQLGNESSKMFSNSITAIYTPFSFILIYEVYLLIYYLPKSITVYIGKQYEIVSLIVIRRIFKDISNLKLTGEWFREKYNIAFAADIAAIIVIFFLIFLFYKLSSLKGVKRSRQPESKELATFIEIKKVISIFLVPLFGVLALYSIPSWFYTNFSIGQDLISDVSGVNKIFFSDFFTVLILIDVFLLLISFINTDNYRRVIRNSGFVISTILIKMSFSAEGLMNIFLIVAAIAFGVVILGIHNLYDPIIMPSEKSKEQ